jgi:Bacteriophage KPP10, Structural protein ORF10
MADQVDTYDPKEVSLLVAGKVITGYAQDTFIVVDRESNQVEDEVGAEGDVARRITNDRRGSITITLLQTSRSNLILSGLARVDELSGDGIFPVLVKDNRGTDLHAAPNSWVQKMPQTTYRAGIESREWVIRTSNLQMVVGGAS